MTSIEDKQQNRQAVAEELRLRGNDAFGTQDWQRASDLYAQSVQAWPTAKACANQAATLCKLGQYEQAADAASRATTLDPKWAKAWWRRGVTAELRKFFPDALRFYEIAVQLEPKEKSFRQSFRAMQQRLKVQGKTRDGLTIIDHPNATNDENVVPTTKAWRRARASLGNHIPVATMSLRYAQNQVETARARGSTLLVPTSQQWLFTGIHYWIFGMQGAIAEACVTTSREASELYDRLWQQRNRGLSEDDVLLSLERQVGGYRTGVAAQDLASGVAHLGGKHLMLEMGSRPGQQPTRRDYLCPAPRFLSHQAGYQILSVMRSVESMYQTLHYQYGFPLDLICGKAIIGAISAFYANLGGAPCPPHMPLNKSQDPSPQDVVDYMKEQLRTGARTWDGGLRQYASMHYRGTILFAYMLRMMGQAAEAYQADDWARQFMNLADEEFKVSETCTYAEKGTAFKPSFRVGFLVSQLHLHAHLRASGSGAYNLKKELALCTEIINLAEKVKHSPAEPHGSDYESLQNHVAYYRKPLAVAHSMIALDLNMIRSLFDIDKFKEAAAYHGLIGSEDDDCDPFALVAKHYHIAAQNELPDADEGAIFWWAFASNMARSSPQSGFTLGELREAIKSAQQAEKSRDIDLFGPNKQKGGSYESIAKFVAFHFREEADTFILPQVELIRREGQKSTLEVGEDVICSDFDQYEQAELANQPKHPFDEMVDTREIEQKYGVVDAEIIPSLETLCIRKLHKEDCEFAKGETDGAVIALKAMMAAEDEEKKNT